MTLPRVRSFLTGLSVALLATPLAAQNRAGLGAHDSLLVATLSFPGVTHVPTADLRRLVFTRASTCRLPFLLPLCSITPSQLVVDRRRTTPAALGQDIVKLRVYLWQRGFRDARVDTVLTAARRGWNVAFVVAEGPATVVGRIDVEQTRPVLSRAQIARALVLHEGDPLDLVALDTSFSRLRAAMWNEGYADARVDTTLAPPDSEHRVTLRITLDPRYPTRVGRVEFEGNLRLPDATLRRAVTLRPGMPFTRDAVLASQRLLFRSPAIDRAVLVTPSAGDSVKTLVFSVAEAQPRHAELTVGFSTLEFVQTAVELRDNALGDGRWIALRAVAGNLLGAQLSGRGLFRDAAAGASAAEASAFVRPTYQASATLTQEWLGGPRTRAALTGFGGRRVLPGVAVDEDLGLLTGIVHERDSRFPIGVSYRLERTRVQAGAFYFCGAYAICDPATIAALQRPQRLAPVGVSAWIDRADNLEVPTRGFTALAEAELASPATGSSFAHQRVLADGAWYRGLRTLPDALSDPGLPPVLALHGRLGWVRPLIGSTGVGGVAENGILHPRTRFYAGGMQSVRGFAENELGPRVLQVRRASLLAVGCTDATIAAASCDPAPVPNDQLFPRPVGGSSVVEANVELRIPIVKQLGAVLFVDAARVGTAGLATLARARGAVTPGGGFRYRSPLGVLRLDLGLRPVGVETLPVVVALPEAGGGERIVHLDREKRFSPVADPSPGALRTVARRVVVHFAMGQAF